MIRLTIGEGRFESASSAAEILREIADSIEDDETSGIEYDDMSEGVPYEVEELCEFCNGDGYIEAESGRRKKCFNCQEHHDSDI